MTALTEDLKQIPDQSGKAVAAAALYDTGSSVVEVDLSPLLPSLTTLWMIEGGPLKGTPMDFQFVVRHREGSPWMEVDTRDRQFAIWRATGDIYRIIDGEVQDEPMVRM